MKVMYSNVDGISSKRLEITDMLKEKKPMAFCMVETKSKERSKSGTVWMGRI